MCEKLNIYIEREWNHRHAIWDMIGYDRDEVGGKDGRMGWGEGKWWVGLAGGVVGCGVGVGKAIYMLHVRCN